MIKEYKISTYEVCKWNDLTKKWEPFYETREEEKARELVDHYAIMSQQPYNYCWIGRFTQ